MLVPLTDAHQPLAVLMLQTIAERPARARKSRGEDADARVERRCSRNVAVATLVGLAIVVALAMAFAAA
jgi:hypothetical protein